MFLAYNMLCYICVQQYSNHMILRYALFLLALLSLRPAHSQGLVVLTDEAGEIMNGQMIHHPSSSASVRDTVSLYAMLTGSSDVAVNVKRYEVQPALGTRNYFCWGVCYTAINAGTMPLWVSQHPVEMTPEVVYNNFHAYFEPSGTESSAIFRFVWFDDSNPDGADSSWVDIQFGGTVGMSEHMMVRGELQTWPNPSMGADVTVAYDLYPYASGAELVIYNVLGEPVTREFIRSASGRTVIPAGSLKTGVYFANIEQQGSIISTRRLVIAN
jgi:hypothetical protein